MGEMIQFKRPDGKTCPGYLATPKEGSGAHGFVCVQEWWGLNEQIKNTADRLAEAGYRALCRTSTAASSPRPPTKQAT